MAGGGKGGVVEPGFLDTATFTLAIVLLLFLLASFAFERSTHWLVHFLRKRKRNGLATAVTNLVTELTLVGFIALLLTVLQDPIANICVNYDPGTVELWSLISNVQGCDCCLKNTATVGSCLKVDRDCGPSYCNCDGADPSCAVPEPSLTEVLTDWSNNDTCTCGAYYLGLAEKSPETQAANSLLKLECNGMLDEGGGRCSEGKAPLISVTTLHQIHIFIFCVAMAHVLMGVIMVLLASYRLHLWRKLCPEEDDEHAAQVRRVLSAGSALSPSTTPNTAWQRLRQTWLSNRVTGLRLSNDSEALPLSRLPSAANASKRHAGSRVAAEPGGDASAREGKLASKSSASLAGAAADSTAAAAAAAAEAGQASSEPQAAGSEQAAGGAPGGPAAVGSTDVEAIAERALEASTSRARQREEVQDRQFRRGKSAFRARSGSIKKNDHIGWLQELGICLTLQFTPRPVAADDIRLMRASFMLANRVPRGFDFWRYISDSMEDDFAQIVGVNLEMWFTLVVFVLISGPLGWPAVLFLAIAAAALLVLNIKLMSIMRHVCRGCRINALSKEVFWFRKPQLLLHPIKYILFLCSFVFGFSIFFVWSFGASSCPFTSHGNAFWWGWTVPWWLCLVIAALIFLDASLRTLPCYSLAVQMGSDFKHHMLPTGVKEKLLRIAEQVKKKHKEQAAAAAAQEGSWRNGSLFDRSVRGGEGSRGGDSSRHGGNSRAGGGAMPPYAQQVMDSVVDGSQAAVACVAEGTQAAVARVAEGTQAAAARVAEGTQAAAVAAADTADKVAIPVIGLR